MPVFPPAYLYKKDVLLGKVMLELESEMEMFCSKVKKLWAYSTEETLEVEDRSKTGSKITPWTKNLILASEQYNDWPERGLSVPKGVGEVEDKE